MLPPSVFKDDTTLRKFMRWLLFSCLDWFRDEEIGTYTEATIIIRKGYSPKICYGANTISYRPDQIEKIPRTISTKDWGALRSPRKMTLQTLEQLFRKHLKECTIRRNIKQGYPILEIIWPDDFKVEVYDEKEFISGRTGRKSMSNVFCILTILCKQPDWMGVQLSKGNEAFTNSIPLGFNNKNLVVYEGKGATYILENGLNYVGCKSRNKLKVNNDCIKVIEHRTGRENWEKEVEQILNK